MPVWPTIAEPELLARLALDDREFAEFVRSYSDKVPPRPFDMAALSRAFRYPWERPRGSYRLRDGEIDPLDALGVVERESLVAGFADPATGRLPLVAIGSNGAPRALQRKFAHFPVEEDRTVLALAGYLDGFDVGVSPQPAFYGALPATLFPSPGTRVRAAVLWVTPAQFTQLAWSELSYGLGSLRTRFEVDGGGTVFDEVLVFVARFGAFCPAGDGPAALAAIPAEGRTAPALAQEQLLDAAAALALGPQARAETLVREVFERYGETRGLLAETAHRAALPFVSERWTRFPAAVAD
jgi:hypothetical protein